MNDIDYMERALQLARKGEGYASPNPMVGAVIVGPEGDIIGEGYHRRVGEGHAEVNAVASVRRPDLLSRATMYVTLEPCSHYGRTPPCAKLIIDKKIPRVVVGTLDPFEKVSGRGVKMLRDAGVEVTVLDGPIADACRALNRRFITAHTLRRPFITLKWARSADGYMDIKRQPHEPAYLFSNPLSTTEVHLLRARHDAILTGSGTALADHPRLDVRGVSGRSPRKYILDRRGRIADDERPDCTILRTSTLNEALAAMYADGITSVLIEAGPTLLNEFITNGLWDCIRIETTPVRLADQGTAPSPAIPSEAIPDTSYKIGQNTVDIYNRLSHS